MPSLIPESIAEWIEPGPIPGWDAITNIDDNLLIASILYRRGVTTRDAAAAFMVPAHAELPDPFAIPNMDRAIIRIQQALSTGEAIAIFGDYDADGVTSTAILALALQHAAPDVQVIVRLPERSEGYGLNAHSVDLFHGSGVNLVIAVDCGSSDLDQAQRIADLGMDLVIFDHHQLPGEGPPTAITVSPQLSQDVSLHDLTAAGVAYLAAAGLEQRGVTVAPPGESADSYLDLAALGTVGDVAPVVGVNRAIIARGVAHLRQALRPGIAALFAVADLTPANVQAPDIAYSLAPRLNAAGRIDSPNLAYDLILATDRQQARSLALLLEHINQKRKSRSTQVHREALFQLAAQPGWESHPLIALHSTQWEAGLIGAVASRLAEELRRPVMLFHNDGGTLHGSARGVNGFDLVAALGGIAESLQRFGGHSLAAGITLEEQHLAVLETHVIECIAESGLTIPAPKQIRIDANLPNQHVSLDTVREINRLQPFGKGNEVPTLRIAGAEMVKYTTMGTDNPHLKIQARTGRKSFEAILWGGADRSRELVGVRQVDLVGTLSINSWQGNERLQMILADFRPAT